MYPASTINYATQLQQYNKILESKKKKKKGTFFRCSFLFSQGLFWGLLVEELQRPHIQTQLYKPGTPVAVNH